MGSNIVASSKTPTGSKVALQGTSATQVVPVSDSDIIYAVPLGATGNFDIDLLPYVINIQPSDMITVAARTTGTTASFVSCSLNVREYQ